VTRIDFNADTDSAFYLKTDPDSGSRPNADPDPGQDPGQSLVRRQNSKATSAGDSLFVVQIFSSFASFIFGQYIR
jgi:hypothetical protein